MSMTEVAYQVKDYANVLVGPEGLGYAPAPFDHYLSNWISNSSMLPSEFAREVVTDYIDWCWGVPVEEIPDATMSATDLTKITSLTATIDDFALKLKEKETLYHEKISLARNLTEEYLGPYAGESGYYIDLYNFAELTHQYVPDEELQNTADQVMSALSIGKAIIIKDDKASPKSHGLSIYFPDKKGKYEKYRSTYEKISFAVDTPWDEFVEYHLSGYVLTIQTPYPNIQVKVDEESYTTDANGKIKVFVLPKYCTINVTTLVSIGSGSHGVFTQWSDGNNSNPRTLFVNSQLTLEAEYETQHRLIMNTTFGTTNPSIGEHWYKAGSSVEIGATSPSFISGERYFWVGWTGRGSGSYNMTSNPASITMNGPINETATWRHEYYLTVASPHGSPTPTSEWFEVGTSINASVTSPASGPTDTRYLCTGWAATGSAPASGTNASLNFTIDKPSSIRWNWKTQYLLTVHTDPAPLSPQPNVSISGPWYDNGTLVICTAQKISEYVFDQWTVDVASWGVGINPISVTMDDPCVAIAHYVRVRAWWETLLRPENLQIILGLVGIVITVALGGTAWIRTRKRRSIIKTFLDEIDDVYLRFKTNPRVCEEELYRLRNTILEGLTDGKITEEHYAILDRKIDKYMKELQEQKKRERQ
jgi:hypothetical protein